MIRLANLLNIRIFLRLEISVTCQGKRLPTLPAGFSYSGLRCHPACIIAWGSNLFKPTKKESSVPQLKGAIDQGAKLIVIDPRKNGESPPRQTCGFSQARNRSGFSIGNVKVMVDENLMKKTFVEHRTKGFQELMTIFNIPYRSSFRTTWVSKKDC